MKRLLCLLVAWLPLQSSLAQLPAPYSGLPSELLTTNYFLPLTGKLHLPPDGSEFTVATPTTALGYVHALDHAEHSGNGFPSLSQFIAASQTSKSTAAHIPLMLVDMAVNDLHPDAFDLGWITQSETGEINLNDASVNPFVEKHGFFLAIDWESHWEGSYTLYADPDFFLTDPTSAIYSIDFDDGQGYRLLEPGAVFTVNYNGTSDRMIRIKAEDDGNLREAGFLLKSGSCASGYTLPDPTPWPQVSYQYPWRIIAPWEDGEVRGNAYLLLSEDGVFDRPFIFVEGIDFGSEISMFRNGTFGWAEFTCGASENYPFLAQMPVLLDALRDEGYDILLLDFEDGADHIAKNAALLKSLLEKVNTYKVGREENVLAGASMGGQITRLALRQMELDGIDHCTRLWISLDSPHQGANVPIGLQSTIEFLANFSAEAEVFLNNFLRRPAAREMLLLQLPSSNSIHTQYQEFMDGLGYPEKTRNIGIANGNINGLPLGFPDGAHLLDFECAIGPVEVLKLLVLATGGDPFNSLSTATQNVISHTIFTQTFDCQFPLGCIFNSDPFFVIHEQWRLINPNTPRLDNAPGGTRASLKQFVTAINAVLDAMNAQSNYPGSCASQISPDDYIEAHSFIPTTSALGIATTYHHMNVAEALANMPSLTPFDRVYGVAGANTVHSEVTPEIIELVLDEVINGGQSAPPVLANGTQFNYGSSPAQVCYDLEISNGGQLGIHVMAPFGAGIDPYALPIPNSHSTVRTSDCGAVIHVNSGGSVQIGEGAFGLTGELILDEGAEFNLNPGSELIIQPGSVLRIRDGARMVLNGGNFVLQEGARLIIEHGGELSTVSTTTVELFGTETYIDLYGHMVIAPQSILNLNMAGSEGGKLRVFNSGINVFGSSTSELTVRGQGLHDAIVEILPEANLRSAPGFGTLRLRDGRVNLLTDANIISAGTFQARDVFFSATGDGNAIQLSSSASFNTCRLEYLDIIADITNDLIRMDESSLRKGKLSITGGRYRIEASEFENACIDAQATTNNNLIRDSQFNSSGDVADAAVHDQSSVDLLCDNVTIEGYPVGIRRRAGELTLRCSKISNCNAGVVGQTFSTINLSGLANGGYNTFINNEVHIQLSQTSELLLQNGGNSFGSASNYVISGTMAGFCDNDCAFSVNANSNTWPSPSGMIESGFFDVVVPDPNCGNDALGKPACVVGFVDKMPPAQYGCAQPGGPFIIRDKSANLEDSNADELDAQGSAKGFRIYPNPANAHLVVEAIHPQETPPQLTLTQLDGKQLSIPQAAENSGNSIRIGLEHLPAGCYLLTIRGQDQREVHRIFVY